MVTSQGLRWCTRLISVLGLMAALHMTAVVHPAAAALPDPAAPLDAPLTPRPGWGWPLDPAPQVVRPFDPPPAPWLPGHRGVDLAASVGQPVLTASAGVVSFSGVVVNRGVVVVTHAGGIRTTYEPVDTWLVRGSPVRAGDVIGVLGGGLSHCEPARCLHWGARRGEAYLNPLVLLARGGPPVLLPLTGPAVGNGGDLVSPGRRDRRAAPPPGALLAARTPGRWPVPR